MYVSHTRINCAASRRDSSGASGNLLIARYLCTNVIITPHLSSHAEHEYGLAVELLIENVRTWRKGEGLVNVVDLEKGY